MMSIRSIDKYGHLPMIKDMNRPPMRSYRVPVGRKGVYAVIDTPDLPLVACHKWYKATIGNTTYAATQIDGKTVYMHRLLMRVTDPNIIVDHKDRDGLNNRRNNLRVSGKSVNAFNSKLRKDSTTGVTGVYRRVRKDRGNSVDFAVTINAHGKRHSLGYASTIEEAVAKRKAAEIRYFGFNKS